MPTQYTPGWPDFYDPIYGTFARRKGYAEWSSYFWARVGPPTSIGCRMWLGGGTNEKFGYGYVACNGHSYRCHQVAWILAFGPIPPGLNVAHHCDRPGCVNPTHLFLTTHAGNSKDMWAKQRGSPPTPRFGNDNPSHTHPERKPRKAKPALTNDKRLEIYWRYWTESYGLKELSRVYDVSDRTIYGIARREIGYKVIYPDVPLDIIPQTKLYYYLRYAEEWSDLALRKKTST